MSGDICAHAIWRDSSSPVIAVTQLDRVDGLIREATLFGFVLAVAMAGTS